MRKIELSPPPCSTESIPLFEAAVAKATGTKHALATSSGTAAIHLALLALGVGPGDVVLCSTLTFCASANPIVYCGATPVFIDCDESWQIDPAKVLYYLENNPAPKAVIAVDLYGRCCDYFTLKPICDHYGVPIIEDAAEALGAAHRGKPAGSHGKLGIISFNLNKIVTAGGGGMLVSDEPTLIDRARFFATQAKENVPWYEHRQIGYNYRMAPSVASYGLAQLHALQERLGDRRIIAGNYRSLLGFPFTKRPPYDTWNHWLTVAILPNPEKVRLTLKESDIESRRVWKPMHLQPTFRNCAVVGGEQAEKAFAHGLCLPSVGINLEEVEHICGIIKANL